jgi:hypothetical protein
MEVLTLLFVSALRLQSVSGHPLAARRCVRSWREVEHQLFLGGAVPAARIVDSGTSYASIARSCDGGARSTHHGQLRPYDRCWSCFIGNGRVASSSPASRAAILFNAGGPASRCRWSRGPRRPVGFWSGAAQRAEELCFTLVPAPRGPQARRRRPHAGGERQHRQTSLGPPSPRDSSSDERGAAQQRGRGRAPLGPIARSPPLPALQLAYRAQQWPAPAWPPPPALRPRVAQAVHPPGPHGVRPSSAVSARRPRTCLTGSSIVSLLPADYAAPRPSPRPPRHYRGAPAA